MHLDFATRTIFDLIIWYCNFSYFFAFSIIAFSVASSGLLLAIWREREIIEPCQHMCSPPRDPQNFQPARCRLLCRSCMVRSTQRPERVAATWSDSNDSTGQLIKGAVRPKFPSKTFTGDMLESVSIFIKMFGLFWWKAGLWPCLSPLSRILLLRQQVEACLSFSKFCNSDFVQNMFDR